MREFPRPRRAYAGGSVDGGDVWPPDLADEDLAAIAAVDATIQSQESEPPLRIAEMLGGRPTYSVAERIRHWRQLIDGLERGHVESAGEYGAELGCRSIVEQHLAELPIHVRNKITRDVVEPLDARFATVTVDDAGAALASQMRFVDVPEGEWWWDRRPATLPEWWGV